MRKYLYLLILISLFGCIEKPMTQSEETAIIELAEIYFAKTIETHPEYAYFSDIPLNSHDGISSNKLSNVKLWEDFEDSLYVELVKINEKKLLTRNAKIAYWFLKEDLESSISMRVCKPNLWNVNPETGLQNIWIAIAQIQPVGTKEFRTQAVDRWNKLPSLIETEINNLKLGVSKGYTMPKEITSTVINQLQTILDYKIEESPFMSPAIRDGDKKFYSRWENLISNKIIPAVLTYQNFLINEYLPAAREDASILSLPSGNKCYQAYIRKYTSTNKTGAEIFDSGQKIVAANKNKIAEFGGELYNTNDFAKIINYITIDSSNYFTSSDEILTTSKRLVEKAKKECEKWFTSLPAMEVLIKPYEDYETGSGAYEQAFGDKPAYFRINLNNPQSQQKGNNEVLTFHETYPGHHVQIGLEKEIKGLHPISKLISFVSYMEGWARYCEELSEEMGLYESKSALITRRAWSARGMVVDPGIHLKGWTKDQAIDYMVESGMNEDMALNLYHRSMLIPAQLTSYDVGGEEIKALRKLAENQLGEKFNIKEFHSKVLENGAIPLNALRKIIEEWIEEEANPETTKKN